MPISTDQARCQRADTADVCSVPFIPGTPCKSPPALPLRRKKKAVHKVSTTDDKRLQTTLKRLGVNTIPGIEEVNLFQDNDVIHFTNPKGQCCAYHLLQGWQRGADACKACLI